MKKSKKSCEEPQDRLSELPDSIIFEIFWLLPMDEVVQTTILSKRWNNLWTTTPYLNFFGHDPEFVNRALVLWKGFRILKFKFGRVGSINRNFSDIYVWMRLCREKGIEELYLQDWCTGNENPREELYCVTPSLYSFSSLKVLDLENCKLQNLGIVQWNQLRSLTMDDCIFDEHSINSVVCGSPQLEVFTLKIWDIDENLSIRSSSLKKLLIGRGFNDGEPPAVSELRIWSPNLETLEIVGAPFGKCLFMNVSFLTHLTIDFSFQICEEDIYGETLWKIFPTIQHVDKVPRDMKEKYLLSPMSNVKFLAINSDDTHYKEIVDVLHMFPKLETLSLFSDISTEFENDPTSFLQVERNLPEYFLLQLRTVEIILTDDDDVIFPLIEILFKHASKLQKMTIKVGGIKLLQKMTIQVGGIKPPSMPWSFAQKLMRMPRSSPTAELIFTEC